MTARSARLLIALALLTACSDRPATKRIETGAARGRNLLLITIDTLRADRIGAYGNTLGLTPTLDQLARDGLRFVNVHAHVPLTLPSHATILTGRYPTHTGLHDNASGRLDATLPTLGSALQSAGYQTAAFVGSFVLDARFGLTTGFARYDDRMLGTGAALEVVERPAAQVLSAAADWIAGANGAEHAGPTGSPWFVWVHLYDPHEPYAPPEPFNSRYAGDPYAGEIAYVDASLGAFFERLRRAGALQSAIVAVTSDHGESLGEHGERTHGLFAYDATLRVPLLLWGGPIRPGVTAAPVGLVDVAPSLLDLDGTPPLANADGRSFLPAINGAATEGQPAYFEALSANLTRNWAPLRGVIADGFKLIDLPIPELYDLNADPNELHNIYTAQRDRATRLEKALDELQTGAVSAPRAPVDADAERRLRSLGYVVGGAAKPAQKYTTADDPKRLVHLQNALERASDAWGRGAGEAAIEMLRGAIRERPDLTIAYDRLAFMLDAQGKTGEAVALLDRAAREGHADSPLLRSLAALLRTAGDLKRSASILEALVSSDSEDLTALDSLGQTYTRMGRPRDAEQAFRLVVDASPNAAATWNNLGTLYLLEGRTADAIRSLSRALVVDPSLAGAHNALGVAMARNGDMSGAIAEWREALRIRPDFEDARANLEKAGAR